MEIQLKKALLTTRPFKYLDLNEVDMLVKYCKLLTFAKDQILMHQGEAIDGMLIITVGKAAVIAKVLGEETIQFASLEQGNFIGEINLIKKLPCAATVIAEEVTECLQITNAYFDMLAVFFPEIHYKITKAITEEVCYRINVLHQKILNIMHDTSMEKRSFFSKLIDTFSSPEPVCFKEVSLDTQQFKATALFSQFSEEEYDLFMKEVQIIKTGPNCALIKPHTSVPAYYLILRGAVQSSITEKTRMAKLSVLAPMAFFGSNTFIDNKPAMIAYTTCERALLAVISKQTIEVLQQRFPLWYHLYYFICASYIEIERAADKLLIRLNSEFYNR